MKPHTKILRLKEKIKKLEDEIIQIQKECTHVHKSKTYLICDAYHVQYHCHDCGKDWQVKNA